MAKVAHSWAWVHSCGTGVKFQITCFASSKFYDTLSLVQVFAFQYLSVSIVRNSLIFFLYETSRKVEILILKELTQPTRAMGVLQLYLTVPIGWRVVHGMDVMDSSCAQTARYIHFLHAVSYGTRLQSISLSTFGAVVVHDWSTCAMSLNSILCTAEK